MKRNIYTLLKILCIAFCAVFLLTACGSDDEMKLGGGAGGETSEEVSDEQHKCWQKELLKIFYKNLGDMTLGVYKNLTNENILSIMFIAFSIWMAFQILRHVSTPSPESIGEFWTKVLRKATICLACGILASSTTNILYAINTFVFPIYVTLLEFCSQVLQTVSHTPEASTTGIILENGDEQICEAYTNQISAAAGCIINNTKNIKMTATSFPVEPLNMMGCMACAVSDRLNVGYSIAFRLITGEGILGVLIGISLLAMFTIAKFGFSLYLIDSIFRLDMMIVIAPFLIMFFPFEQTRKWTTVGFKIILNSAALMLCIAILLTMTMLAMQNVLLDSSFDNFGEVDSYKTAGIVPISMLFLGFVIVKACGTGVSLSDSVTGGSGDTRFQKKMAALVGTIAKGVFHFVTAGAGRIATVAIEHSERLKEVQKKVQKAQAKVQQARNRINSIAGRNGGDEE